MRYSLRTKIVLMCLLIALNFILRYPISPHEIGWDSFIEHTMANSVSEFGYAKWWIHPTSIYGAYSYSSSPSAVPFVLSGIAQCMSINTELAILLYSIFLGIFCIFAACLMAGVIWDNDIFKFLVVAVFSTSQGIVTYSTWTANARTLFVVLLPLFIYLLLNVRAFKVRCGISAFIILALLLVTHHYIYFTLPVVISFFIVAIFFTLGKHIKSIKVPENVANFAMLVCFLIMFSIPFFTRTLAEADPGEMDGGRYAWLFYMVECYTRYVGIYILFAASGYIYLSFKRNKRFEEWFLLLCLATLAQFLYIVTYMKWFIIPFITLLIGIALTNVAIAKTHTEKRNIVPSLIIIAVLLVTICFTGYYQYLHFLNDPNPNKRYMEERTYVGGMWMKDNIDKEKKVIAGTYVPGRLFSISEVPTLTGIGAVDLAYGFVDPDSLEIKQVYSYKSVGYYMHDPYIVVNHTYTDWYVSNILRSDINIHRSWARRLIPRFNLSYYIENKDTSNRLSQSVQETKDCLYDNGKIRIWDLNEAV